MKLLRLKITDSVGFRSLHSGFEYHFRTEDILQKEIEQSEGFAPFVCAGPNGSGKSNLLEALAAIFFQLEILRVRRNFLPDIFQYDPEENPLGIQDHEGYPNAYEIEYLIKLPKQYLSSDNSEFAHIIVIKEPDKSPLFRWKNNEKFPVEGFTFNQLNDEERDLLIPQYVLGYSSGENEILSLPFFKMRFIQFDEYWNALTRQLSYPGRPETRLAYLDNSFSQAILLCNLLFQDENTLRPFRDEVGIESLLEFRIIIRCSIVLTQEQLLSFSNEDQSQRQSFDDIINSNPALSIKTDDLGNISYHLNLIHLLEGNEKSSLVISALKRCATLYYIDEITDTLVLDYWVNDETKQAFSKNFDSSPLALFQAFQVLLMLNLYTVNDTLKTDIYRSNSHYVSETVPTLASDQRIMRFKFVQFSKQGVMQPIMLKELSDGEHQLIHSLGLCLLFRGTNSLFLLDEPETHFNPAWRASFITQLGRCLNTADGNNSEMLITTHSPFLISDSQPNKVLVFNKQKDTGKIGIEHPEYNTLGASINKITHETFEKHETIGESAQQVLRQLLADPMSKTDPHGLARKIMDTIGDSVERTLAVHTLLNMPNSE